MRFLQHPVWLVGFRPFFALAFLSGMLLPVLWALMFSGLMAPPATTFAMVQWHAHEMFFGFGWAVLGGFLLTASKNWVQIRGYHGAALALLAAAWLFERLGMWCEALWPRPLFLVSNDLFLVAIVVMLMATLIRHRGTDSFRDNYFFLLLLPAFLVAKHLLLSPDEFRAGAAMAIGLFRLAFLVMLERTLTQFMKGVFQVAILRDARLDLAIKALALLLVVLAPLTAAAAAWVEVLLAILLAIRFAGWKPHLALGRLDLAVMYLGYLAIVAQLLLDAAERLAGPSWIGAVPVHTFTFGVMGLIVPAMMVRISKGHTGRKVQFDRGDKLALQLMIAGFLVRIVAPQLAPAAYLAWIDLSAACWFACFALLAWRYLPFLLSPRADGKEH